MSAEGRDAVLSQASVLYLTTRGRTTGRPRRVELWFAFEQGAIELLSHTGSHWYRNIAADPEVELEAGGRRWAGRATILDGSQLPVLLDRFQAKYGETAVRQWYRGTDRVAVRVELASGDP